MSVEDAKRVVLQHVERNKVNASWLAGEIGEHRQTVWSWLNGVREPNDPTIWLKIASSLGLTAMAHSEVLEDACELALEVLMQSENIELKTKAANLIREIQKKYLSDR